jgi:hypothetical protein
MPKPACVRCQCFYRPKTNGVSVEERMPVRPDFLPPEQEMRGRRFPEHWQPYKVWMADLWECPDCGHQLVAGYGGRPIAEDWESSFEAERALATVTINDC